MKYPKMLLEGLSPTAKESILKIVESGGYKYNEYGECCLSDEDDDGIDYSEYCTSDELAEANQRMKQFRERIMK